MPPEPSPSSGRARACADAIADLRCPLPVPSFCGTVSGVRARPIVLLLLAGITIAGCGRREEPGSLDAKPPAAVAAASGKPLAATALRVRWGALPFPTTVETDKTVPTTLSFTNTGDTPWPDKAAANPQLKDGSYAVRVTHAWIRADETKDGRIGAERTDLPRPVLPGESMDLPMKIRTPSKPGDYRLTIELVQELVQWFADRGAERIIVPVHVVAAGEAPAGTTAAPSGQPPKAAGRQ